MPKTSKKSPGPYPSKAQWMQLFNVLNKKEKIVFSLFAFLTITSFSFLLITLYLDNTKVEPTVGGYYSEAIIGFPRFINPVYAQANDVDRDLVEIIFSGLMTYDSNGKLIPQLAKEYSILEDGKIYQFVLKDDIFWHDKKPLTIDDIIFTIKTIQNPDFKSPLRVSWSGIEIERVSDNTIRFVLQKPSSIFLEYCTFKIIPEHIWKSINPENFPLSANNLKPIGSGPYKFEMLEKNQENETISLTLARNENYFAKGSSGPYISKITFYFFSNQEDLIKAYSTKDIKGLALTSPEKLSKINLGLKTYSLTLPRYFALFFNLNPLDGDSKTLIDDGLREALNYATDKEEIIQKVLLGYGQAVNSPVMPRIYNIKNPEETYSFDIQKAQDVLENAGFEETSDGYRVKTTNKSTSFQFESNLEVGSKGNEVTELQKCLAQFQDVYPEGEVSGYFGQQTKAAVTKFQEKYSSEILTPNGLTQGTGKTGKSTRAKLNELCNTKVESFPLKLSLITVNQPLLVQTANIIKEQWAKIGIELNIQTFDISTLERDIIKKRDYQILLFGEVLGSLPDPFPFWHSSQQRDPGLNLSLYENKDSDRLLEEIRKTFDENIRKENLEKFQENIINDLPAIFLYNPDYLYLVSSDIKGVGENIISDPSKRLSNIENWYINTKRVLR
ncbi:peptidoglycan-binding protein [Patescibacteria group bacterium]|nr:peptidoglycan-binding protein [Patescibacteria group bacterium]MBU1876752.1 peptidoglycan-binding protein [Patescibacteria group bacterium]